MSEPKPRFTIYEVFVQKDQASPHMHVGSVDAGSPADALLLARENFLRRDDAVNIWVVAQDQVHATPYGDPDYFGRTLDRSYRTLQGYSKSNTERWRKYKQNLLGLNELVKD